MKILVIEDNAEWTWQLTKMINSLGYKLAGTTNSMQGAQALMSNQTVDMLISNVAFRDENSVEFLQKITALPYPVLFVTDCTDESVYKLACQRKDSRYLVKPFHALTLRSAIESLEHNPGKPEIKEGIVVRGPNNQRVLVAFARIHYIRVEKNYCFLYAQNKKYALKISLARLILELDERFVQTHKGFCINSDYVTRTDMTSDQVFVNDKAIPIGYSYRKKLIHRLADKLN